MQFVELQMRTVTGSWMTFERLNASDTDKTNYLQLKMQAASARYPDKRIRAISSTGHVLDIMG